MYCQNKPVSSFLKASTPHPGLQLETVQLARLPISFSPRDEGSKGGSVSVCADEGVSLVDGPRIEERSIAAAAAILEMYWNFNFVERLCRRCNTLFARRGRRHGSDDR